MELKLCSIRVFTTLKFGRGFIRLVSLERLSRSWCFVDPLASLHKNVIILSCAVFKIIALLSTYFNYHIEDFNGRVLPVWCALLLMLKKAVKICWHLWALNSLLPVVRRCFYVSNKYIIKMWKKVIKRVQMMMFWEFQIHRKSRPSERLSIRNLNGPEPKECRKRTHRVIKIYHVGVETVCAENYFQHCTTRGT